MASKKEVHDQNNGVLNEKRDQTFLEDARSSKFGDEKALKGDYSGAVDKTDPEEIGLVKKLDLRIMPIVWMMYFLNYVDRNAIASARLNGLEEDLGLVGSQYNTCISILFVGYLIMQIPSNLLMSSGKVRPSIYMSICMACWAVVSACTALTKSYGGLVAVRFFLGIAEAPFYPGALYLLSCFYTRKEIALRISILYSGNIVATAMSGLIALSVFETIDGAHGLKGWQWLFIIEGVVTFAIAILGLIMLPDHPLTTRWLTSEERELAHQRILADTVGSEESKGVLAGFKEALRDPRLYLLAFMQNMHLSACSFNNFFPTVIGTLGFNQTITLALTCPPYLVSGVVGMIVGRTSGKLNERCWHITVPMGVAVAAFIVSCATLNTGARYFCCFLFTSGAYAVNSVILGWVSATLGQTTEKKSASLAVVNVVANASYVYTAYLYPDSDEPRYLTAMSSNAAFGVATIISAWALRFWLQNTNKKIQRGALPGAEDGVFYAY
ncbi:major facilitator superfamily domain-containing protein [Aspergillus karnatakaensis]|uniref:major facilitator superfamily domain-containing protein n=1 Tax=Aspergillus karnatakaensis TaxID=1810916 RepID=UPI003CCD4067